MFEAAAVIVIAYLALVALVYFRQEGMLYFPTKEIEHTPREIGLDYVEVKLTAKDGVAISAWYIPAQNERGVVLFCHGNAGNISHRLDSIKIFHDLNLSVFIFDYRGYGRSGGKPSEKGTYLDAEAAWYYLVNVLGTPMQKIIVFGRSIGGAVAAELALRKNPAVLIIESSFTSVPDLGQKLYPWLPVRLISKFRYATIEKINKIICPKLIIHSPQDEIIPFAHGLALYENASPPKEILRITGGHNEGFLLSGQTYVEGMKRFITEHIKE